MTLKMSQTRNGYNVDAMIASVKTADHAINTDPC